MIQDILEERGNRYGKFAEHARITQELKDTMTTGESWDICTDSQREALEMIAHKIGRIVNGDPSYDDSWTDIIGYTQLVLDELEAEVEDEVIHDEAETWEGLANFVSTILPLNEDGIEALEDIINIFSNTEIPIEDTDNQSEAVDEPEVQETDISDKLQMIEINGIKVFISGSELEKLDALKESEKTEDNDHEDQTFMDFNLEDELTYHEFLRSQARSLE